MQQPIVDRPALPHECQQIAELHRTAFGPNDVSRSIFASPKVARYLASLIAWPLWQRENILWVIWTEGILAAYAHFRAIADAWHLNQIAVKAEFRSRGFGGLLWQHWIDLGRAQGYERFTLQVASDNTRALNWYERRGLRITCDEYMYEAGLNDAAQSNRQCAIRLKDWERAAAEQALFGFSTFQVASGERIWSVGRLWLTYFRVRELLPPELEFVLASIDPSRRLLILSPQEISRPDTVPVAVSYQMQTYLS